MPPGQFGLMQNKPEIYLWPHWHGSRKNLWTNYFFFLSYYPFIRSPASSVTDCCTEHTFCRSKTCTVPRVGVLTKGGSVQVFVRSKLFPVLCKRDLRLFEVVDWSKPVSNYGKAMNSTTYLKEPGELSCDTRQNNWVGKSVEMILYGSNL